MNMSIHFVKFLINKFKVVFIIAEFIVLHQNLVFELYVSRKRKKEPKLLFHRL